MLPYLPARPLRPQLLQHLLIAHHLARLTNQIRTAAAHPIAPSRNLLPLSQPHPFRIPLPLPRPVSRTTRHIKMPLPALLGAREPRPQQRIENLHPDLHECARILAEARLHPARKGMHEAHALILLLLRQLLESEVRHHDTMLHTGIEREIMPQFQIIKSDGPLAPRRNNGDDASELTLGGCGLEEREQQVREVEAGVVVGDEFAVEVFGGGIAAFEGEEAGGQEEEVEGFFARKEVLAYFADGGEERDVFADKGC